MMSEFLSCDWGTSTFRLRLADAVKKKVLAELKTNDGIANTHQQWISSGRPDSERVEFYRRKLMDAISLLSEDIRKNMPVIVSGMASSGIGLKELPYREFPFSWDLTLFPVQKINQVEKFSHPIFLVSGFKTKDDVMRGEESLLLGCEINDNEDKIFIFPGTHSKHVFVKNKSGYDLKTYMTGEIFNLLAEKSILRFAVAKGGDEKSFLEGFKTGLDGNLLHGAFLVRTRQLLLQVKPESGYQFLSGLLIGAELGQLKKMKCPVYVVCDESLKQSYLMGLETMKFSSGIYYLNSDEMLIRAHCKLAEHYF